MIVLSVYQTGDYATLVSPRFDSTQDNTYLQFAVHMKIPQDVRIVRGVPSLQIYTQAICCIYLWPPLFLDPSFNPLGSY